MGRTTRQRRVEPTDDWEQLALLCRWPTSVVRDLVLATSAAAVRSARSRRRRVAGKALGQAMRLEGYAPRAPRRPWVLQEALFAYAEAL